MLDVDRFNAEDGGVAVIREDSEPVGPLAIADVDGQLSPERNEKGSYTVTCDIPMEC